MSYNLTPGATDLWFLPLGGTGEIGMNMNLIGHDEQWLMIDCGATFQAPLDPNEPTNEQSSIFDVVCADPSFIQDRLHQLVGIVLTHAHEDHIGALPKLIERLNCPIYATPFTAEVLKRKLYREDKYYVADINQITSKEPIQIGEFQVEWLNITHSIPDSNAMLIKTKSGTVFHTADWKIDRTPVLGEGFQNQLFEYVANQKPLAMICDSTNATRQGYTGSEAECYSGLHKLIDSQAGRVVVTCFASNVARLITLARIANESGRYMAVLGRSLENMISIARSQSLWPEHLKIINKRHVGYLPRKEVLIVATGSQGERQSALGKLSRNTHRDCELEKDDTVIFSSIAIPGNEKKIESLLRNLSERGVIYFQSESTDLTIHSSGHPSELDLRDMYKLVNPRVAIPTHGEMEHLKKNTQIAKHSGVTKCLTGFNGDLFVLHPLVSIKRNAVKVGRIDISS